MIWDQRRVVHSTILVVALAVAGYAVAATLTGTGEVLEAVSRLSPTLWALVLGLSLLNYALRFLRWQWYLRLLGHPVPATPSLLIYLGGFALTATPGKAGEAVRSVYLKEAGVPHAKSLACLFVERLLDTLAMVVIAVFLAAGQAGYRWLAVITGGAVLTIVLVLGQRGLQTTVGSWLGGLAWPPAREIAARLQSLIAAAGVLLQTPRLLAGGAVGVVAWGAEGLGLFVIMTGLGLPISAPDAAGVYAVSVLVGALSFLPGGLGGTEAVMALLLMAAGADPAVAVAGTVICRLATLWFAVAVGLLALGALETHRYSRRRWGDYPT